MLPVYKCSFLARLQNSARDFDFSHDYFRARYPAPSRVKGHNHNLNYSVKYGACIIPHGIQKQRSIRQNK